MTTATSPEYYHTWRVARAWCLFIAVCHWKHAGNVVSYICVWVYRWPNGGPFDLPTLLSSGYRCQSFNLSSSASRYFLVRSNIGFICNCFYILILILDWRRISWSNSRRVHAIASKSINQMITRAMGGSHCAPNPIVRWSFFSLLTKNTAPAALWNNFTCLRACVYRCNRFLSSDCAEEFPKVSFLHCRMTLSVSFHSLYQRGLLFMNHCLIVLSSCRRVCCH